LIEMSEFTMLILKDRAERRGVVLVDSIIREGDVRKQLLRFVQESHPDRVVVGWPLRGAGQPRFGPEQFKIFVEELEREGNTIVTVAPSPPGA
jgi:RNase H-fold protein (predicted Holliday junction resolvase)